MISGSEDGNVYIWDREPLAESTTTQHPHLEVQGLGSPLTLGSSDLNRAGSIKLSEGKKEVSSVNRSSPAYYPPRANKPAAPTNGGSGVNVKPVKILQGHGYGAVFDVRWRDGEVVSAGEDGMVGIWQAADVEEE